MNLYAVLNLSHEYGRSYTERLAQIHERSNRRIPATAFEHVDIDRIVA